MMKWPSIPLEDYFRFNENFKDMPSTANSSSCNGGTNHISSFDHMVREVDRFNSFYEDVLRFHDLLENIDNIILRRQLREIMNKIEDDFVNEPDLTTPKCLMYNTLRLGVIGGSLSGKSALLQRYLTGKFTSEDALPGRHKKTIDVNGNSNLLLIRDETGPPDPQLSLWLDAVMLVFNMADELSFNVISSYYAKILQNRTDKDLPCILVAIKDVENIDNSCGVVEDARIKKFISEHRKCPFFYASLETGENIEAAFQMAAEKIVQYQNAQLFPSNLLSSSASFSSINSNDSFFSNTLSKKQIKRRNTLFSMKTSEKKEKEKEENKVTPPDDFGSGRQIPVKQGYLYKRHQSNKREWKKKFVLISDDQVFSYYPSMKDYMDEANAKSIKLIHASVKVPGKRKTNNQSLYRSNSKSHSSQNLAAVLSSPIKNRSNRNSASDPLENQDCYVISNSSISEPSTDMELTTGSPTIHNFIERSSSDGRDVGPPQSLRNAQSQESVSSKSKHRSKANRYKSCEIEYQGANGGKNNVVGSDGDVTPVMTPVIRKRSMQHRRQKSGTNIREAIQDVGFRGTDTEDDDCIFSITNIDGKTWHFECTGIEERDSWVRAIEQQILKAYQESSPRTPGSEDSNKASAKQGVHIEERLFAIAGNNVCADCGAQAPEWVSLNLGVLICIECSGVHRNLGTHLSKVRSLLLDDWPPEYVAVLEGLGNQYVNSIYEANIREKIKPKPNSKREEREKWISEKYEKKEFIAPLNTQSLCQELMVSVKKSNLRSCYLSLLHGDSSSVNNLSRLEGFDYKVAPLHVACSVGNVPITQLLLWSSADPKILDERCFNPIFYANKSGSKQCAELLFSYGCPEDTPC